MNRLKSALDRALAGVELSPALERRILASTIDGTGGKRMKRKLPVALVAALIALLLVGVALATGLVKSIFEGMKGMYINQNDEKYAAMDELSDRTEAATELAAAPGCAFIVRQTYYDGEQLAIGYAIDGAGAAADFAFGPGHALFAEFEQAAMSGGPADLSSALSEADWARFQENLADHGAAGVIYQHIYLGDGLYLSDGTELPNFVNTEVDGGTYIEVETPLPDAARGRDSLSVVFDVRVQTFYYYQDASGSRAMGGPVERENVTVEIPRASAEVGAYEGEYSDERYAANASVVTSPVNVRATIVLTMPEEWLVQWDSLDQLLDAGQDILYSYALVIGGQVLDGDLSETTGDGVRTLTIEYECPATGAAEISLRPVYSVSGPVAAEDIAIPLR